MFKQLGKPKTIGDLKKVISNYPDDTSFGFRNMPLLELVEIKDDDKLYVSFQYPENHQTTVMNRTDIYKEIGYKEKLIDQFKSEIIELQRKSILLCDEFQRFEEKEEEIVLKRRPKKTEKRLIGRIFWNEKFKDQSSEEYIMIERSMVVRVNGEWNIEYPFIF